MTLCYCYIDAVILYLCTTYVERGPDKRFVLRFSHEVLRKPQQPTHLKEHNKTKLNT